VILPSTGERYISTDLFKWYFVKIDLIAGITFVFWGSNLFSNAKIG
jgi:hypothetical protein